MCVPCVLEDRTPFGKVLVLLVSGPERNLDQSLKKCSTAHNDNLDSDEGDDYQFHTVCRGLGHAQHSLA